jgi:hypothetical protein
MQNPMSLAGLLVAQGKPYSEAITEAANISNQYQQQEYAKQRAEQEKQDALLKQQQQQQIGNFGNLLRGNPNLDRGGIADLALQAGIQPQNLEQFVSQFAQKESKPQTFKGAEGIQYEQFQNPETGQLEAKPIPGQQIGAKSSKEVIADRKILEESAQKSNADSKALKILNRAQKTYNELQQATENATFGKPGSTSRDILPEFLTNAVTGQKAKSKTQALNTLKTAYFNTILQGVPAGAQRLAKVEEMEIKGLFSPDFTPEAMKEYIFNNSVDLAKEIAKNKFLNIWAQKNNGNPTGYQEAYQDFISIIPEDQLLTPEMDEINGKVLQAMPAFVTKYLQDQPLMNNQSYEEEQPEYEEEDQFSIGNKLRGL